MWTRRALTITLTSLLLGTGLFAQEKKMPSVFLVGDSISMQYTFALKKDLQGHFKFDRKSGPETNNLDIPGGSNGGNSSMVLGYLKLKYAEPTFHPDLLLVNAGLHDIKRDPKTNVQAVSFETYAQNLAAIEQIAHSHGSTLVWITTTPINDSRHNKPGMGFFRYNADVVRCNDIAQHVLGSKRVPIIDLYTLTVSRNADAHYVDHAHYDTEMQTVQADFIAGFLLHPKK